MTRYHVSMTFKIVDEEAAELNATVFGKATVPHQGGFSTTVEAYGPSDALSEGLAMALRFNQPEEA